MKSLNFFFYKVKYGHCTYVEFPNDDRALIDLSRAFYPEDDPLRRIWDAGVRKIDHLFITHPHPNHIEGLKVLLDNFKIGNFNYSGIHYEPDPIYDDWVVYERMKKGEHVDASFEVRQGLHEEIGAVRVDYLAPPKGLFLGVEDEVNNNSLMLLFSYGKSRVLICGDSGKEAWRRVPDDSLKDLTLLLASHHGDDSGYYAPKVRIMKPEYTVISAGWGTPHDADKEYWRHTRKGVYTTRTKQVVAECYRDGTVVVS